MGSINPHTFAQFDHEVQSICEEFLSSLGLSYFHFRRNFKEGNCFILSNKSNFLQDFIRSNVKEINYNAFQAIDQTLIYFWDDVLTNQLMEMVRDKNQLYHGVTIIERYKDYFDCFAFAMSKPHPSPVSYYFRQFNDLKRFCEKFPEMARDLIENQKIKRLWIPKLRLSNNEFLFLPERSDRIALVPEDNQYITTYELLCLKLVRDGKSYRDIGTALSMSPRTVETHLTRLKRRTNLTTNELILKSFRKSPADNLEEISQM